MKLFRAMHVLYTYGPDDVDGSHQQFVGAIRPAVVTAMNDDETANLTVFADFDDVLRHGGPLLRVRHATYSRTLEPGTFADEDDHLVQMTKETTNGPSETPVGHGETPWLQGSGELHREAGGGPDEERGSDTGVGDAQGQPDGQEGQSSAGQGQVTVVRSNPDQADDGLFGSAPPARTDAAASTIP